jgi:hypothetical protein
MLKNCYILTLNCITATSISKLMHQRTITNSKHGGRVNSPRKWDRPKYKTSANTLTNSSNHSIQNCYDRPGRGAPGRERQSRRWPGRAAAGAGSSGGGGAGGGRGGRGGGRDGLVGGGAGRAWERRARERRPVGRETERC